MFKNVFDFPILLICVLFTACTPREHTLTILHTNDTHSQVLPVSSGSQIHKGGYARRMGLVQHQRKLHPNALLLDAGDFSQGTPFFNVFHGHVEMDALNRMHYDAATLGNHEFDNGLDTLAAVLRQAHFPIVCANYDCSGTVLENIVKPYTIIRRGGLKIGVFGLGVNPESLISTKNFAPIRYLDPIETASRTAAFLRHRKHCDVVICLSHQGTEYFTMDKVSDVKVAQGTRDVDIFIGGHTHKLVSEQYVMNVCNDSVLLVQMVKAGTKIGKITLKIQK